MKTLTDHLSQYAAYHRDRRNILTHFIGIPMIVLAIVTLLSRPALDLMGFGVTPALAALILSGWFYLKLDLGFGVVMTALLGLCVWIGSLLAAEPTFIWLGGSLFLFVIGWIFQFVGHYYEGRKPAFVDDLSGLIIGPLFVVAEVAFLLGFRRELNHAIEIRVGPVHIRKANQDLQKSRG